jgi:hypothetical protein
MRSMIFSLATGIALTLLMRSPAPTPQPCYVVLVAPDRPAFGARLQRAPVGLVTAPGPSSCSMVAVDGGRSLDRTRATASACRITRSTLSPASSARSASVQPRREGSASRAGNFETSSSPAGPRLIPSKSLPIPTCSTPATRRTCPM